MIVYSMINVPYASLLGAISSDPTERNSLSSYRMSFAFIGSFVTFMLLQPMIDFFSKTFGHQNVLAGCKSCGIFNKYLSGWMGNGRWCDRNDLRDLVFVVFQLDKRTGNSNWKWKKMFQSRRIWKNCFNNAPWWILVATGLGCFAFQCCPGIAWPFTFSRDYVQSNYKMAGTSWDMTTIYFLVGQGCQSDRGNGCTFHFKKIR